MNPVRVIAIIPARYGSQRLPAKPLADICGKPMVQHVYERTAKAKLVNAVFVATDDERIATVVQKFGGQAVMTPASLQTGTDRIAYAARSLPSADIIVNVQGDEPVIEPTMIDEAVAPLVRDSSIQVGTLVRKIESAAELTNPGIVKVVLDHEGNGLYFSRSPIPFGRDLQQNEWLKSHTYYKHFGLYVFRREFLNKFTQMKQTPLEEAEKLEQLRILENGYKIHCTVTTFDSVTVDTQEDLERVRRIVAGNT
ncbi:MAG TPA: 3-deoxy-manno-octulosonate cytidylyltransferase [Bacteroidetes bacterium]|nr:3-deoxy-manno-octulosonate cytidylyltransferase [Bacteroidota bacterium]